MKDTLRKLFSPLLKPLEAGTEEYSYKPSHRTILIGVGSLFLALSTVSIVLAIVGGQFGAMIPSMVFFIAGWVCVIVGALGSDRAIAKIWGNRS